MELKDYFRDELAFIKFLSRQIADDNPQLGTFLSSIANSSDIEFLFENFAFLMAKLRSHIEDAFPELTQNLLTRVWPSPIRLIPATSILRFYPKVGGEIHYISQDSEVQGETLDEELCLFRLTRSLTILPLILQKFAIVHSPNGCVMTLKFEWQGTIGEDRLWNSMPIELFLGTDIQVAGLLQLWFQQYLYKVNVVTDEGEFDLSREVVKGFCPTPETLTLPLEIKQFWRLQLLQEYFHLPHLNDFITIDMGNELSQIHLDEHKCFTLVFHFNKALVTDKSLTSSAFLLNCVPIINLFTDQSDIYDFVENQSSYVLENYSKPVFQITSIYSPIEPTNEDKNRGSRILYYPVTEFTTNHFAKHSKLFYQVLFDKNVRGQVQSVVSFVDSEGNPVTEFEYKKFTCSFLSTNGLATARLKIGDICLPSITIPSSLLFNNITPPTQEIPALVDSHKHWPIISYLSLSPLFLKDKSAIIQLLRDLHYHANSNLPRAQTFEKYLTGVIDIQSRIIDWIWDGIVLKGIEMTVCLDPTCFSDEGEMYRFGFILSQVLPYCITHNNFLMVKIINQLTDEIWHIEPIRGSRGQV